MLKHKKILLGITGGIAAYKCAALVRLLVKEGAEVKVLLTKSASEFITPQTLSVLSKNQVISDFFDADFNWNNHVHLAEWADVMLIAPLTANTLAKMAAGQCDSVLLAAYFSSKNKTIVAPAMDLEMYKHPTVKKNLKLLQSYGNLIILPENGELASGLIGEGRMAEPETIVSVLQKHFFKHLALSGKTALINAGPTHEAIDPVRFIGNKSSGKMGLAIAKRLAQEGAEVTLVLGPNSLKLDDTTIHVISVESSDQMYEAMRNNFINKDIVICSAAVADYKPEKMSKSKIKKKTDGLDLKLVKTKDILQELGKLKKKQFLVGFALETEDLIKNASAKLIKKNLDLIVANSATEKKSGIGSDFNKVSFVQKHNKVRHFELKTKEEVAKDLVDFVIGELKKKKTK